MREIKFRAWDKKNNWMVKPDALSWDYSILFTGEVQEKYEDSFVGSQYDAWRTTNDLILLQYTGLKDKNGVEIYEGDIIQCGQSIAVVEWDDDIDQDFYWGNACGFVFNFNPDGMDGDREYEIVGNIYENKELLNK